MKNRAMNAAVDHASNLGSQAQISYVCTSCQFPPVEQKKWANDKDKSWCVFFAKAYKASIGFAQQRLVVKDAVLGGNTVGAWYEFGGSVPGAKLGEGTAIDWEELETYFLAEGYHRSD